MLTATLYDVTRNKHLRTARGYIVDFGFSRILDFGPGRQPAVELPHTIWERPREGVTHFDPYAWDMLCVGRAFKEMLSVSSLPRPRSSA